MRPNSSLARNSLLRLKILKTTVMWRYETNERILNEGFVNVIIAVEMWWTSPEVLYKRYKDLYEKSNWDLKTKLAWIHQVYFKILFKIQVNFNGLKFKLFLKQSYEMTRE